MRGKQYLSVLLLLLATTPGWAAKKITVQQLHELLNSSQQEGQADIDVSAALKEVELTEELTAPVAASLAEFLPGQLSTAQLNILQLRSAMLAPPATEMPSTPAPDAAAQKAILEKAFEYASTTYARLPAFLARKVTSCFQDNTPLNKTGDDEPSVAARPDSAIRFIDSNDDPVRITGGAEENPIAKDKTAWGENGRIASLGQQPVLSAVLDDARAAGKLSFVRWQMVDGRAAAVFSFAVDKKKTHYLVDDCCFAQAPENPSDDWSLRTANAPLVGGVAPRQQNDGRQDKAASIPTWKPFKATVPYHGEIFVDPETGIVVRLNVFAEFKSSDPVRQEDQRIDYGVQTIDHRSLVLPLRSIVVALQVPYGNIEKGRQTLRRALLSSAYRGYRPVN